MAARELPVLPLAASSASSSDALQPLEPFVLAPTQSHSGDNKLRDRVTGVAIATAVYFAASALIQVLCGLINEKRLENNLRALAQVEAVPELLWLVDALPSFILLSAVPILIISFVTGCLFATCGIMGAKANSECCACCYCCCNASYCLFLVVMLGLAGAFLHNMSLASGMAELWFARCDPKICYPLGYDTNPQTTIDCLAPAVWDEYRPQLDIDHLPQECPPMYLECGESSMSQDVVEERFLQEVDDDDEREEPREEVEEEATATEEREEPRDEAEEEEEEATTTEEREEPREEAEEEASATEEREEPREEAVEEASATEEISPADSAADSDLSMAPDAAVEGASGGDGVLELQQPEPAEEVEEAEEPEEEEEVENPAQGTEKDRDSGEEEDRNEDDNEELQDAFVDSSYDRSEGSPLKALAESNEILGKVLAVPMPEDPVKECQPSKIVALYKVASKEAPAVFDAVWKQGLLRLICILPGLLLMSLGFWWGHEHWTKLTSKTGEATPYVLGLPFGETNSADVQMTHMSQPLMTQQQQ